MKSTGRKKRKVGSFVGTEDGIAEYKKVRHLHRAASPEFAKADEESNLEEMIAMANVESAWANMNKMQEKKKRDQERSKKNRVRKQEKSDEEMREELAALRSVSEAWNRVKHTPKLARFGDNN